MSDQTPVTVLLAKLSRCSPTISAAYFDTRLHLSDENAKDVAMLRQFRLLSPDVRDAFRLRGSFRQFLNTALSTERLYAIGANIGGYFERLSKLIEEHSYAFHEGRDVDCERYETDIREAISDIADAVDDDLTILQVHVATKFAAVATLAEKRRQNEFYQQRTQALVDLLENFHFAGFGEQLAGNEDLLISFRALFEDRLPAFRESLKGILQQLNQYLFEFRKVEERTKRLRGFALYLSRNPDWGAKDWDDSAIPPEWVRLAHPLDMAAFPDSRQPQSEDLLRQIALTIASTPGARIERRPPGIFDEAQQEEPKEVVVSSPLRKAVRAFLKEASVSAEWISARKWWVSHPSLFNGIREDIWLLRLLAEDDWKDKSSKWKIRAISNQNPEFDGNIFIRDVMASHAEAQEFSGV